MSVRNRYKPRVVAPFRNQPGNSTSLRQGSDGSCSAAAPLYRRYISCGLSHYRGFTNGCTQFLLGNFMPIFCCYSGVQDVVTYLSGVSGLQPSSHPRLPVLSPMSVVPSCGSVPRCFGAEESLHILTCKKAFCIVRKYRTAVNMKLAAYAALEASKDFNSLSDDRLVVPSKPGCASRPNTPTIC